MDQNLIKNIENIIKRFKEKDEKIHFVIQELLIDDQILKIVLKLEFVGNKYSFDIYLENDAQSINAFYGDFQKKKEMIDFLKKENDMIEKSIEATINKMVETKKKNKNKSR